MKSLDERLNKVIEGVRRYGAEKAIIFGSSARGDADQYSDIDLIVVKRTDRGFVDRLADVVDCIKPDFALDVFVYTPEEFERMREEGNPLVTRALEEGEVIYEGPTS